MERLRVLEVGPPTAEREVEWRLLEAGSSKKIRRITVTMANKKVTK